MNDLTRYKRSLENLLNAQKTLERFIGLPITNDRDRAGIIQAFEYTFELAWKTLQKYAQENGILVNGPKMSMKEGMKFGFIRLEDEEKWLQMLDDRNLTSHAYEEEVAKLITGRIIVEHTDMLRSLCEKLSGTG